MEERGPESAPASLPVDPTRTKELLGQYNDSFGVHSRTRLGIIDFRTRVDDQPSFHERIADYIPLSEDGVILDVGSGAGPIIYDLYNRRHFLGRTIGLDIDTQALMLGKQHKNYPKFSEKINFIRGDMSHLPLPDNSVDVLVSSFVYHHTSKPNLALEEAHRVLKENGLLIAAVNSLDQKSFHTKVFEEIADFTGAEPPKRFASQFNTVSAPNLILPLFDIEEIYRQEGEMKFFDNEVDYNDFRMSVYTYLGEFDPALVLDPHERNDIDNLIVRMFNEQFEEHEHVSDNIDRAIYVCRKKSA